MTQCAYCQGSLTPFARFSSERVVDLMLTPQLQATLPELRYGRCQTCGSLMAIDERQSVEVDLLQLYEQLPADYWADLETGHGDRFFQQLEAILNPHQQPLHLCDVGCGDGSFLTGLGTHWQKTGIEPGHQATAHQRSSDIRWIRGTLSAALSTADVAAASFDVLTYIDVTEHLADPRAELEQAWQVLKPGGKLVIYTGNAHSLFARLAGANWAYLRCAGHIAVASQAGLQQMLSQLGFVNIQSWKQNHPSSPGLGKWLFEYAGSRLRRHWAVPLYQDHLLMVAQRPSVSEI